MSKGWAIGSKAFKKDLFTDHNAQAAARALNDDDPAAAKEEALKDSLSHLLKKAGCSRKQVTANGKSEQLNVAVAAAMKSTTTVANAWLRDNLALGSVHEISRRVAAWNRTPDRGWRKTLK